MARTKQPARRAVNFHGKTPARTVRRPMPSTTDFATNSSRGCRAMASSTAVKKYFYDLIAYVEDEQITRKSFVINALPSPLNTFIGALETELDASFARIALKQFGPKNTQIVSDGRNDVSVFLPLTVDQTRISYSTDVNMMRSSIIAPNATHPIHANDRCCLLLGNNPSGYRICVGVSAAGSSTPIPVLVCTGSRRTASEKRQRESELPMSPSKKQKRGE